MSSTFFTELVSVSRKVLLLVVGMLISGVGTPGQNEKNILVLHGGWSKLPFNLISDELIETAFNSDRDSHVELFNEYIDEKRLNPEKLRFPELLRRKYFGQKIDLILTVSPAALEMLLESGSDILPGVPVVFTIVDYRMLPDHLPPNFTGVTASVDFAGTLELALLLQPDTQHVFYVVGVSRYEQFLRRAATHDLERFRERVDFDYLEGLPLTQLLNRVAQLPAHSVVFYQEVNKDSNGETYVPTDVGAQVSVASNSPMYAPQSVLMGKGIVAGSLMDYAGMARQATDLAKRILKGEQAEHLPVEPGPPNIKFSDWRQLQRWKLSERRLPPGTIVEYREPGLWQKYKQYLILGLLALFLQSILIVALAAEAQKRKKLASQLKDLSRRLIDAQEGERRRIARELHDDLNQRMVLLISHLERLKTSDDGQRFSTSEGLLREAQQISKGISHLSHQLHSSALHILGLEPALRGLARDLSLAYEVNIQFAAEGQLSCFSDEVRLCLFRVAQESLTNVVKHSGATFAEMRLCTDKSNAIRLIVKDNGKGFDPSKVQTDSLGIISMCERLRLVDGQLLVHSSPSQGTEIVAHVRLSNPRSAAAHTITVDKGKTPLSGPSETLTGTPLT